MVEGGCALTHGLLVAVPKHLAVVPWLKERWIARGARIVPSGEEAPAGEEEEDVVEAISIPGYEFSREEVKAFRAWFAGKALERYDNVIDLCLNSNCVSLRKRIIVYCVMIYICF